MPLCSYEYTQKRLGHNTGLLPAELASGLGPASSKSLVFGFISKMVTWVSEIPQEASVRRAYYQIHLWTVLPQANRHMPEQEETVA